MRIKIENTGIIQRANVKLSGLNIIGGDNDTGKSTVGKLIFAIVKAVSRYEDLGVGVESAWSIEDLASITSDFLIRGVKDKFNKEVLVPDQIAMQATLDLLKISEEYDKNVSENNNTNIEKTQELVNNQLSIIYDAFSKAPSSIVIKMAIQEGEKVRAKILNQYNVPYYILDGLRKTIISEFQGEISPKNQKKISEIQIVEEQNKVLSFSIKNNNLNRVIIEKNVGILFDDVTFIETPMIMQMSDLIRNATTILDLYDIDKAQRLNNFSKPKVPLHVKDLMTKLENAHYFANPMLPKEPTQYIELQEKIATIINGSFIFDPQDKEFAFAKKTGKKNQATIKAVNTASGVKSFGLIQMLLQTGILDHRSLVVIDEPETHLHPKWQLEYAKILIELVKNNISVLVASHSPYFIQALKVFSEREGIKDKTNFYLSEKNEKTGFVTINEVTKDLNKLFATLAAPLKELL